MKIPITIILVGAILAALLRTALGVTSIDQSGATIDSAMNREAYDVSGFFVRNETVLRTASVHLVDFEG